MAILGKPFWPITKQKVCVKKQSKTCIEENHDKQGILEYSHTLPYHQKCPFEIKNETAIEELKIGKEFNFHYINIVQNTSG